MVRVLIVDDHQILIAGLRRVLELQPGVTVIGAATSIESARGMATTLQPDVILLDLRLPDSSGPPEVANIKGLVPKSKIIVLTGHGEGMRTACMRYGADAFLLKENAAVELIDALRRVCPELMEPRPRAAVLSIRESEVAALAANGKSNQEIADQLFISLNTVKTHLAQILKKLGLRDRVELAVRWPQYSAANSPAANIDNAG